jgi:signal peptidase I
MPGRRHTPQSRLAAAAVWLAMGFALALLIPAVLPSAVGYQTYVVRSESMEPSISRGDVLVTDPIAASKAKVGDVVTFDDPESGDLITHRVRSITPAGDQLRFVTKGDANEAFEGWQVSADASIPRLSYKVPKLGYATLTAEDPERRLVLIGVLMLVVGAALWFRQRGAATHANTD